MTEHDPRTLLSEPDATTFRRITDAMPYGASVHGPNFLSRDVDLNDVLTYLDRLRVVLAHVAKSNQAQREEHDRLRDLINGGAALLGELTKRAAELENQK